MIRLVLIIITLTFSLQVQANECLNLNSPLNNQQNDGSGIGGTGHRPSGDGVGGTGHEPDRDGIGGTGQQAIDTEGVGGTGIVGIVTGFASICVNGVEVHYNEQTNVDIDGKNTTTNDLKRGQLVAIDTDKKHGQLHAKHISISHAMVGEIEQVSPNKETIRMMGKTVKLKPDTIGKDKLKPGQSISLSGLVSPKGDIYATRIDPANRNTPSVITGLVDQRGKVNGISVTKPIKAGQHVQVKGHWNGSTLVPDQVVESPVRRVTNRAQHVIIQGVKATAKQNIRLRTQTINIDKNTKQTGTKDRKDTVIVVHGNKDENGVIQAQSIEYLDNNKLLKYGGGRPTPTLPDVKKDNTSQKEAPEKTDAKHEIEKHEDVEKSEKAEYEKPEKVEYEKPEKVEYEKPEKVEYEKPEKVEYEKPEKIEYEKPEKIEYEKPEKIEYEKPEKIEYEKPEKIEYEKPEKIEYEKPEKIEYEKPEKIEYEKPEKIEYEKPEKIEYEKPEDIELPEH